MSDPSDFEQLMRRYAAALPAEDAGEAPVDGAGEAPEAGRPSPAEPEVPAGLVAEAVTRFRAEMADIDNLGESGDGRDLYVQVDRLTAAVAASHPGSLCRAGCSGCCDSATAIFDAAPAEWARIEAHLARAWSPERRAAFLERFSREHGERLWAYRALGTVGFFEPLSDAYFARQPYRCPFLEAGRCSIYAVRPLACRMYGAFATRTRWYQPPTLYACAQQSAYLHAQRRAGALQLPATGLVLARFRRLARGRGRILPLWIARWAPRRADLSPVEPPVV